MSSSSSEFPTDPYSAAQQKWLYQDHLVLPTLESLLKGKLDDKKVLDIGCGNGHNSTTFLKWGAAKVVGFDYSEEMIRNCKSLPRSPKSEFYHLDVCDFSLDDRFDVATAVFVLQYVHDKEKLRKAIRNISSHLNEGAVLIGLLPNGVAGVCAPETAGELMGAAIDKRGDPYVDGELVTANFYEGKVVKCTSTMALHSNVFYEKCFKEAGFKSVEWLAPTLSDEGRRILGEKFCHQFLNPPVDIVFRCSK